MRKLKGDEIEALIGMSGVALTATGFGAIFGWPGALISAGLLMVASALSMKRMP